MSTTPTPEPTNFAQLNRLDANCWCGAAIVTRMSGPLPGCPQGVSTGVCSRDATHAFEQPQSTPEPQPLSPEAVLVNETVRRVKVGKGVPYSALAMTVAALADEIEKLQAEKAESDARLAAVEALCEKYAKPMRVVTDGASAAMTAYIQSVPVSEIRKAISGGKQNG